MPPLILMGEIVKIRALRTLVGEYGRLEEGDVIDVSNDLANQLIALGYVVEDADARPAKEAQPEGRTDGKSKGK